MNLLGGFWGGDSVDFLEVFVNTPLEVCEQRDPKGLYKKARAGELENMTGIDDPYEIPVEPEIFIDTSDITQEQAVQKVMHYLENEGFLA